MAAMGARPKWVTLNLTLPQIDQPWLKSFIKGFAALLNQHQAQLVGGDTTQGPLSITVTVIGETAQPITRHNAQIDDLIVVSGELGSAAFALNNPRRSKACNQQLKQPEPRLDVSEQVKHLAHAMIDVSDGLLADLGHICEASQVGAVVELSQIPSNPIIHKDPRWQEYVLAGGDDYQLCFTVSQEAEDELPDGCHIIGQIIAGDGIVVLKKHQPMDINLNGYQHFEHD